MHIAFVHRRAWRASALVGLSLAACIAPHEDPVEASSSELGAPGALPLRGTNLAGAEFGETMPGTFGVHYTYPTLAEVDYFVVSKRMTALRIPFRWQRLQHALLSELDDAELARLDAIVDYATSKTASVILDPHDYARYAGGLIDAAVPNAAFADLWRRLADHYKTNARVVFGLMNEPYGLPAEHWVGAANAAIAAIRELGSKNLILVPGVQWTGAHSWASSSYGTPNATAMLGVTDPLDNFAFEVHQYVDSDFSGTHADCKSSTAGSEAMHDFTSWLRLHHKRGFVGELGGGWNPTCAAAIDDQLQFLEANSDVYLGWTWWAAGPWWGGYFLSIEPTNGQDSPMMSVLAGHLPQASVVGGVRR